MPLNVGSQYEKLFLSAGGLDETRNGKKTFFASVEDYVAYMEKVGKPVVIDEISRRTLSLELHERRVELLGTGQGVTVSPQ